MKYSQPKRSFRFQGHAENVLLLCLKQQHIKTAINRSAAFCPLPCGGQEPCGRFYRPFFCGSHAPSSDAFFRLIRSFHNFLTSIPPGYPFAFSGEWFLRRKKYSIRFYATLQRFIIYQTFSPCQSFLQKTFLFQSFFPQSIGKVVENHAIL